MGKRTVAIALGGGGAKGLAHIGVLKVLHENNIPIDFIAGTSMGAVIGALYSATKDIKKVESDILQVDWKHLFDYTLPTKGIIRGNKIESFLREKLNNIQFKDLKIPLLVTAFDIENKTEVVFSKGDVATALRASISIPGVFVPVINNGRVLIDGGVVDPIPTEILEDQADIIIAVNVNNRKTGKIVLDEEARRDSKKSSKKIPGILESASKSLQILSSEVSKADLIGDETDFTIDIDLEDIGMLDFKDPKSIIKRGEIATRKLLSQIRAVSKPNPFKTFLLELEKNLRVNVIGTEKIKRDLSSLA